MDDLRNASAQLVLYTTIFHQGGWNVERTLQRLERHVRGSSDVGDSHVIDSNLSGAPF
jgi:hypothetical protein